MKFESLQEELNHINVLKKKVEESLKRAPKGKLRSKLARGKYPQYFLVLEETRKQSRDGRFIKAAEKELIGKLAQKEYDQKVRDVLEYRGKVIGRVIAAKECPTLQEIYDEMPPEKRKFVKPYILPDDLFVKQWYEQHKGGQNGYEMANEYETERGEKVRSKSEVLIANKLYYNDIPYQYEPKLNLPGGGTIFPDFVLLNVRKRKTYYFEHFGMMDDTFYCASALQKIEKYEKNGIFPGEHLLITAETSVKGIDMKLVDILIKHYLL